MDLTTNYLGMKLRTPLVASASPLSRNVDDVKRLEEAGVAAVVFHSVFEEQLQHSPPAADFRVDPELYLNHIAQAKESVSIPIIGSVNAAAPGSWVGYVRQIEQAGADALELNIYTIPNRHGSQRQRR
jgi:dihydroorotate dehydrogenase (fumarate)